MSKELYEKAIEFLLHDINAAEDDNTYFYYGIINNVESILSQTKAILKEKEQSQES